MTVLVWTLRLSSGLKFENELLLSPVKEGLKWKVRQLRVESLLWIELKGCFSTISVIMFITLFKSPTGVGNERK